MSPLPNYPLPAMSFQKSDKSFILNNLPTTPDVHTLHAHHIPMLNRTQEVMLDAIDNVEQLAALYDSLPDEEKYVIAYSPLILESDIFMSNVATFNVETGKVLRTLWRNQVPESVIWNMMTSSKKDISTAGIDWCSNPKLLADIQPYLVYSEEVNAWMVNPATPYDLVQALATDEHKKNLVVKYVWNQNSNSDMSSCRLSTETLGYFLDKPSHPGLANYAVRRQAPSHYVADALMKNFKAYQDIVVAQNPDREQLGLVKEVLIVILDELRKTKDKDYAAECYESYLTKAEEIDFTPGLTPVDFLQDLVDSKFTALFGLEKMEENLW